MIFLMFCLGLEFSLRKLFKVGATAFIAAFTEIVLMIWIGFEIGRWFGWSTMDSLFGAIWRSPRPPSSSRRSMT